jgi:hypothetical protein
MSRSGYSDDIDQWDLIRWRGQVASAIRGKRGQSLLRDLLSALDSMPEKALIKADYENEEGDVCTLGALGKTRGIEMRGFDPEDYDGWANTFGVAHQLIQEITFMNDDGWYNETPEQRWQRMRSWVADQIRVAPTPPSVEGPSVEGTTAPRPGGRG